MDTRDDDEYKTFIREVDAVVKLNTSTSKSDNRDQSINYFEDSYISHIIFVTIVIEYADGGTLAQEILRRKESNGEPFAERRIAFVTSTSIF